MIVRLDREGQVLEYCQIGETFKTKKEQGAVAFDIAQDYRISMYDVVRNEQGKLIVGAPRNASPAGKTSLVSTTSSGQEANASVQVSDWRLENKMLVRTYEFSGLPPPEVKTTLEIEFYVSKAPSGYVHTRLSFNLRPYLYLVPDRSPFPDHFIDPPFSLGFFGGSGAGTEESPALLGMVFSQALTAFAPEGEDMAVLELDQPKTVNMCIKIISSGANITFFMISKNKETLVQLRLELPNDQKLRFTSLYQDLLNNATPY
jgi:hypothetical protein